MGANHRTFGALIAFFIAASSSWAAPAITDVTIVGSYVTGSTITITGTDFGTKSPAKPTLWFDGEDGTGNPSNLGSSTSWTGAQNMAVTSAFAYGGSRSGTSQSGWETTNAYVAHRPGPVTYGTKLFVNFRRYTTQTTHYNPSNGAQNTKYIRIWRNTDGNYPNWYIGTQQTGGFIDYVEDGTPVTGVNRHFTSFGHPGEAWREEEYKLKLNSAQNASDGHIEYSVDRVTKITEDDWQTDTTARPGHIDNIFIEEDPSNFTATGNVWFDNIYADVTWSRVYMCDATTLASATECEMQIPTAWSATEITAIYNKGTVGDRYIIVCDSNDSCSSGFDMTAAGGAATKATVCPAGTAHP